jgi:hypothetical protein
MQKQTSIYAHAVLRSGTYFEDADNYVRLHKIYSPDDFLSKISIWIDMIISPLMTIVSSIYSCELPGIFSILGFYKCIWLWIEWFIYKDLAHEVSLWVHHIRSIGGPFISTNDPTYQSFVYAHAMQDLHYSFFPKN